MTSEFALSTSGKIALLFASCFAGAAALLLVAYEALGVRIALQGSYVLFGLLLAAAVHYGFDSTIRRPPVRDLRTPVYPRLVLAVAAITLAVVAVTGYRRAVVPGLVVGYVLVAAQLRADVSPVSILAQIVILFTLSPAVKYLTTGFYFGNWDTLYHVRYVEVMLEHGSTAAIEGTYSFFPALHALVGSASLIVGVPAYEAVIATGIVSFALLVVVVYAFARTVTHDSRFALLVALAATFIYHLSLYAAYFFPQSLAVLFLVILLYLSLRLDFERLYPNWLVVTGLVIVVATLTHHLTFVLFLPVFLLLVVSEYTAKVLSSLGWYRSPVRQRFWPLTMAFFASFAYWLFVDATFFAPLAIAARDMVDAGLGGSFTVGNTYELGVRAPSDFAVGVDWLLGVPGAYFTALLALFVLGIVFLIESSSRDDAVDDLPVPAQILAIGVIASAFVLRSPLSAIKSPDRIGLVWVFFFAFVLAAGLRNLLYLSRGRNARLVVAMVAFILVLGTLTPLAMPNDFYGVQDRTTQTAFTSQEYESLESTTDLLTSTGSRANSFVVTNIAMYRFGYSDAGHAGLSETGIEAERGLFVYRTSWSEYQVQTYAGLMHHHELYVSRGWLARTTESHNKMYDAGPVGMLWTPEETILRPESDR